MEVAVGPLPGDPLAAAAQFHTEILPRVIAAAGAQPEHLTLVFEPADYTHEDWRRAAVATLARVHAPVRINAVAGGDAAGTAATADYIAAAPGLTGQYLVVDPG
ncbi:MAG: hypothetical protein KGL54_04950 [Sphingomonadales bacterium]|nr:hypothetical protein [Sphingomonadales bacterium]